MGQRHGAARRRTRQPSAAAATSDVGDAQRHGESTAAAVSHSCACIGSPCLRHCVHGASIGSSGRAQPDPTTATARRRAARCGGRCVLFRRSVFRFTCVTPVIEDMETRRCWCWWGCREKCARWATGASRMASGSRWARPGPHGRCRRHRRRPSADGAAAPARRGLFSLLLSLPFYVASLSLSPLLFCVLRAGLVLLVYLCCGVMNSLPTLRGDELSLLAQAVSWRFLGSRLTLTAPPMHPSRRRRPFAAAASPARTGPPPQPPPGCASTSRESAGGG
jgi:hypothetical protein